MSHETKPTLWNANICSECGFALELHHALYGSSVEVGGEER